jgi:hypothetical protein
VAEFSIGLSTDSNSDQSVLEGRLEQCAQLRPIQGRRRVAGIENVAVFCPTGPNHRTAIALMRDWRRALKNLDSLHDSRPEETPAW